MTCLELNQSSNAVSINRGMLDRKSNPASVPVCVCVCVCECVLERETFSRFALQQHQLRTQHSHHKLLTVATHVGTISHDSSTADVSHGRSELNQSVQI